MKRTIIATLAVAFVVGLLTMTTGCATTGGRYFKTTREHQPHAFRNRIYNPADPRYADSRS